MKRAKKITAIILTLILCLSVSVPVAAASANYTKAVTKYKSWLTKTGNGGSVRYYDIADIDGNGVPELMTSGAGESRVYTYNATTRKMVLLKKCYLGRATYGPMVTYNTKKKSFTLYSLTNDSYRLTYYKLSGTKATKTTDFFWESGKLTFSYTDKYTINGKSYSKSAYDKKLNSAKSGFTEIRCQM